VGEGPERAQLERTAGGLGLLSSGAVAFLGRRDDVPRLLRSVDVLCLTSDHEGFPNVLLEGMAAALPAIATTAGDAAHVVEHGSTGYVVPPEDEPGLAHWLAKVAADADLRRALGRRGRRRVEAGFARSGLPGSLLAAYASLASVGRREELAARLALLAREREAT
jgi:glycosyltransferase involved in cell wall biosynthesis